MEAKKANDYKSSLYENYVAGIIDKDDYKTFKESYSADIKRYESALRKLLKVYQTQCQKQRRI